MTIGDILAVIAALLSVGAAWTATLLLTALAFPARTAHAQAALIASSGACLLRGLGILFGALILVVMLRQNPAGPVKLLSGIVLAGVGLVAALGSAGIVRLLGERIREMGAAMSPFAALTRASLLYAAAGYLPVIGWICVLPFTLALSLGAGAAALAHPYSVRREAPRPELGVAA